MKNIAVQNSPGNAENEKKRGAMPLIKSCCFGELITINISV